MPELMWGDDDPRSDPPPPLDIERIIGVLNLHAVDFIVIGGFAVIAHGNPRATYDLDVIADLAAVNLRRLAAALTDLNARIFGVDGAHVGVAPTNPDDLALGGNWVLVTDAGRLDIMSDAAGAAPYDQLNSRAIPLKERLFKVVGLNDLIAMKQAANRDKDRADIRALCTVNDMPMPPAPHPAESAAPPTCGEWMPISRAVCSRQPNHAGRHRRR